MPPIPDFATFIIKTGFTWVGAVLAAWAAFKWFGAKWIEAQFAKELESFKHAKNREIEHLRGEVNALLDRTVKLHTREFEVLPLAWDKLSAAFGQAIQFTSRTQSYPDLERMDGEQLDAFLEQCPLDSSQKADIKYAERGQRADKYIKHIFWHQLSDADRLRTEFHNYIIVSGIFIRPALKEKMRSLSAMISTALREQGFERQHGTPRADRYAESDKLHQEGVALYADIERDVQARLWARKLLPEEIGSVT